MQYQVISALAILQCRQQNIIQFVYDFYFEDIAIKMSFK